MKNVSKGKKMNVLLLIFISVGLGVFGQLSMKKGMNSIGAIGLKNVFSTEIFSIVSQRFVFLGIVLYVFSSMIWLVILSQEELSFVYPLISVGYIITAILSKFLFNESLTFFRFFGILLICSGVYLIVLKI
jgi:multidrug transporter EmrE-like cation transporter